MSTEVVPPPEDALDKPAWVDDSRAKLEEKVWGDEEKLKGQRFENRFRMIKHSGWFTVFLMWFFLAIFTSSVVSWIWHFLMPLSLHWLDDDQLSKIQSVIFSGAIAALVSTYMQKHFND